MSSSYSGFLTLDIVYLVPNFLAAKEQSIFNSSLFVTEINKSASLTPASLSTFKLVQFPLTHITSRLLLILSKAAILLSIIVTLSPSIERYLAKAYPTFPAPTITIFICISP